MYLFFFFALDFFKIIILGLHLVGFFSVWFLSLTDGSSEQSQRIQLII